MLGKIGNGIRLISVGNAGYYRYMRFKQYLKLISGNQIINEKLSVINFFDNWGSKATKEAYGISRSTIYDWKRRYLLAKYNPESLLPKSKRPKTTRRSYIDPLILEFIRKLRSETYRPGKSKIKTLLDEYCAQNNLPVISESLIGKIIKRNRFFFPPAKSHHNPNSLRGNQGVRRKRNRISPRYQTTYPGELVQVDSITIFKDGIRRYLITGVDLYSRFAFAMSYKNLSSKMALDFIQKFEEVAPFKIVNVKTDNGHEFLGYFEGYLKTMGITQYFSYPRTPKSNAFVERFNRTIQEEFIEANMELFSSVKALNRKLMDYLVFFNAVRPHRSLNNLTPMGYLVFKGVLSNMSVTHTRS